MKTALQVIGILIICISGVLLLLSFLILSTGDDSEGIMKFTFYCLLGLIIGIYTTARSSTIPQNSKKALIVKNLKHLNVTKNNNDKYYTETLTLMESR